MSGYTSVNSYVEDVMGVAPKDVVLLEIVDGASPRTIADVLAVMHRIDGALEDADGLKWFNRLYMTVTEEVDGHPPQGGWKDATWLLALDVVFAGFYFRAVAACLRDDADAPGCWRALMEQRYAAGVDRIQFALCGMNAHINHDLALALLATDARMGVVSGRGSAAHADYEAVNGLLEVVTPGELMTLAVDTLGVLAQDTGKVGRMLAFWKLRQARDLAWDFAQHLRGLEGVRRAAALKLQDQLTGVIGRALLAMV